MDKLFLSIGAMKSGTTWLYRQLEQHPNIRFSLEKELHFLAWRAGHRNHLRLKYRLSRAVNARTRAAAEGRRLRRDELVWYADYLLMPRSWSWYERRFGANVADCYCADFSNLTALLDEAAWRALVDEVTDLRVVYVLRDPLDRIWSHLKAIYRSPEDRGRLAAMTRYVPDGRLAGGELLRHSLYGANLGRLLTCLPRDRLHTVMYEQIECDPVTVLRGIEDFLGVPRHDYLPEKLRRRINASDTLPRPHWVGEHFFPLLAEDLHNLQQYIAIPDGWAASDRRGRGDREQSHLYSTDRSIHTSR